MFQDMINRKNFYAEYRNSEDGGVAVTWETTNHYFLGTSDMPEGVIIYGGKIIADAKADSLYEALGSDRRLSLAVEGNAGEISSELNRIPEVLRVKRVESDKKVSRFTIDYKAEADVRRSVFNAMARINCPIIEMRSGDESLEDMYLRLIEKAKGGER